MCEIIPHLISRDYLCQIIIGLLSCSCQNAVRSLHTLLEIVTDAEDSALEAVNNCTGATA